MVASVVYKVPDAEFADIVQTSPSVSQVIDRLGGGGAQTVKKRMRELGVELGKKNGHSKPESQKRSQPRQQKRKPRRQTSTSPRAHRGSWSPWPLLLTLGGVGGVIFAVDQLSRASVPVAESDEASERIEELRTWVSDEQNKNDNRYKELNSALDRLPEGNANLVRTQELARRNRDSINQLELKKIPSLEDTKKLLSDITTKSNEFQAVFNEAKSELNKTESKINNLQSQLQKSIAAAQQSGVEVKKGPSAGDRIAWSLLLGFVGLLAGTGIEIGIKRLWPSRFIDQDPSSGPAIGGLSGLLFGAIGAGWPLVSHS